MIASEALVVMEDHDDAYRAWKAAGYKNCTLLHFDAHIDFKWISPAAESLLEENSLDAIRLKLEQYPLWSLKGKTSEQRVHIGNYIHQAIQEGIVGEFVWIYPDDPDSKAQARAVWQILHNISIIAPHLFQFAEVSPGRFEGKVYGISFSAMPFSQLEKNSGKENVLLNIDLDFLIVRSFHHANYPFSDLNRPAFWLLPQTFAEKIEDLKISPKLITFAYSVEEGYTPLAMKFLGQELVARLTHSLTVAEENKFDLLRNIALTLSLSRLTGEGNDQFPSPVGRGVGDGRLKKMAEEFPDAAIWFHLAMLHAQKKQWQDAQVCYQKAIAADPSYRTKYNHPGPILWDRGFYSEAAASYEKMKRLDPEHPDYQLFDVKRLTREKKWNEAISRARQMILQGIDSFELRLCLGECLFHLKQYREAWSALTLDENSFFEELKFPDYLWLKVQIALKLERLEDAVAYYQRLNQFTVRSPKIHWGLAALYFKKRNFYKAKRHAARALRQWFLKL